MDLGSRYLGPLANTSRKEVLLIILRSPVIMWPAGLYMYGELAQVQSGGLNLKSSILSLKYIVVFKKNSIILCPMKAKIKDDNLSVQKV